MTPGTAAVGTVAKYQARNSAGTVVLSGDVVQTPAGQPAPVNALGLLRLDYVGGEQIPVTSFAISAVDA